MLASVWSSLLIVSVAALGILLSSSTVTLRGLQRARKGRAEGASEDSETQEAGSAQGHEKGEFSARFSWEGGTGTGAQGRWIARAGSSLWLAVCEHEHLVPRGRVHRVSSTWGSSHWVSRVLAWGRTASVLVLWKGTETRCLLARDGAEGVS